jgi:hypothetical protein
VPAQVPACLRLTAQSAAQWHGALASESERDLRELLAFVASQQVADISISRPDLETIFMRYYNDEAAEGVR